MKIVIDLQGAQSESRFRGIGRYSLSLSLEIARIAKSHKIWIVLNGSLNSSIVKIRKQFETLIPAERILVFELPFAVAEHDKGNDLEPRVGEMLREYFINQLNPDMLLVTSLFEGFVDNATVSIGQLYSGINTAVILYDLIPYFNKEKYLPTQSQQNYYDLKIDSLKRAGLLLSISDSSKNEAFQALSLDNIYNISTAVDRCFCELKLTHNQVTQLFKKYQITRKVIMYAPGGFDYRKNFDGLISAYSQLPNSIRANHQLVIVSKPNQDDQDYLIKLTEHVGLSSDELILTGYVSNTDLIQLYNVSELFVFPSKHEGFGLPVLEAMSCGAVVIGSDSTSIPEVIGWKEALFDPYSVTSIKNKIEYALTNKNFRKEFKSRAKQHITNFSWNNSASKALQAIETFIGNNNTHKNTHITPKPRLAYFSPLPPVKSGISGYSIELLPELSKFYDITLIVNQVEIDISGLQDIVNVQTDQWFLQHANDFDRVMYQLGNSPYHSYMQPIFNKYPGIMVLHDFYMSGMLAYEELIENKKHVWKNALFNSHGYGAIKDYYSDSEVAKITYPCNLNFIANSLGVITHSAYSNNLIQSWYGTRPNVVTEVIPLLRKPKHAINKVDARKKLNIELNTFVVCSFGFIDATKLNDILLDAWLSSDLHHHVNCKLIFVGENHGAEFGKNLQNKINKYSKNSNIEITGWTDNETFKFYLEAADVGVQLRKHSRGETSAAALDCMNYENATIVNANGALANIPKHAVLMLPDIFNTQELTKALETLYNNKKLRRLLAKNAKETILSQHNPFECAKKYSQTIEKSYLRTEDNQSILIKEISRLIEQKNPNQNLLPIANSIYQLTMPIIKQKQLLIDVTSIIQNDLKTGIERVVRAQLLELIKLPPSGYRIEPIYFADNTYWYAREYTCEILQIDNDYDNQKTEFMSGDIFYGLDFSPHAVIEANKLTLYNNFKIHGISINFVVYDLLPVIYPEFFPTGADEPHHQWLKIICEHSDNLICISNAVASELKKWKSKHMPTVNEALKISSLHLGADLGASNPSKGITKDEYKFLNQIMNKPTFLMVGTIEPRKGYLQILEAFETIWEFADINLVIVGHEGWTSLPDEDRRTIPSILKNIKQNKQFNQKLFWLKGISDEYLEKIYQNSSCLIAASESEGFGLPLIEAAKHNLSIIARDIPVFKEVAGESATYFKSNKANIIATFNQWLKNYDRNKPVKSSGLRWITWQENSRQLLEILPVN